MAPSIAQLEEPSAGTHDNFFERPSKRRKTLQDPVHVDNADDARVPPHPLGVKPLGNAYTASVNLKDACGTFLILHDELILQLLEYLPARSLVQVGATCKALYAFTRAEEIWKSLFIAQPPDHFLKPTDPSPSLWRGTWRSTYLDISPDTTAQPISCVGLYSDALYRPQFCAHVPLEPYTRNIPPSNELPRLSDLTAEEFNANWADKPFILTAPVKTWPAYKTWSLPNLLAAHGRTAFTAEAVTWPLHTYASYMANCAHDESPLYLFDPGFASKMHLPPIPTTPSTAPPPPPSSPSATTSPQPPYTPPPAFTDTLSHLGPHRPDHAWLIIGPRRSGSTFHQDPNGTSAWNAVLRGRKYWLLFPPHAAPPGVFASADMASVTAPLSIAEYLVSFHGAARRAQGCCEAVCEAGEVLHVPAGWWHLVLNIGDEGGDEGPGERDKGARGADVGDEGDGGAGVAVTQNFVPEAGVGRVLRFLRERPEQVSGFAAGVEDAYRLVVGRLREAVPELVERVFKEQEEEERRRKGGGVWERVKGESEGEGGFSFGLCGEDLEGEDGDGVYDDDNESQGQENNSVEEDEDRRASPLVHPV